MRSPQRLSRRAVLGGVAAAAIGLGVPASAQDDRAQNTPGFVDAHVHLNDVTMQLRLMDESKIGKSVIFCGSRSDNDNLLEADATYPGRFFPFASVSPEHQRYRDLWRGPADRLSAELDSLLASGRFRGIGEISVTHFPSRGFPEADFDPAGPHMRGIMDLATRYSIPVNIHCEVTRLREMWRLLEEFPQVTVIWAHGGYTQLFLAERSLERHPNLVYELSARTWANHPRSPDYTIFQNEREVWPQWLELISRYPDRFVVGTDASNRDPAADQEKIRRVQLLLDQLPTEVAQLVSGQNLLRILGG